MLLDSVLLFSEDQDLSQTADTYNSTNTIDTGTGYDEFGVAQIANLVSPVWFNVVIPEGFTSGGSATLAIDLQDSADNQSFVTTGISVPATAYTAFTAGTVAISVPLKQNLRRYLKIVYTIGGATTTKGTATAWLGAPARVK